LKSSDDSPHEQFTIALLPWGDLIEDFLDTLGLSLQSFQDEMTGGWLFGWIEALQTANVRTVLFCFSAQVQTPTRLEHKPTGATIWVLPPSRFYLKLRRYVDQSKNSGPKSLPSRLLRRVTRKLLEGDSPLALRRYVPYLSTRSKEFSQILQREQCRAIVCQEYEYPRFDCCTWIGKRLKLPVFATFQGGVWQWSWLERTLRHRAMRDCAGLIIAPRHEMQRVLHCYRIAPDKIARIFNPMSSGLWNTDNRADERKRARQELGYAATARVVMCHGRIDIQRKGLDVLLNAWQQVCDEHVDEDIHLLLVGTGEDAPDFRNLLNETKPRNVKWIDEYVLDRAVMKRYLCAADVYVLPSRHEGFPVAPLEAMACGLPVVAAAAPGVSDIFEKGEQSGGIVVPLQDAPALAQALSRLLDDEELRRLLAERAHNRVLNSFTPEVVGTALRSFFEERGVRVPV
jgi:starch synthase